jgi:hypothetical protein
VSRGFHLDKRYEPGTSPLVNVKGRVSLGASLNSFNFSYFYFNSL